MENNRYLTCIEADLEKLPELEKSADMYELEKEFVKRWREMGRKLLQELVNAIGEKQPVKKKKR